MHQIDFRVIKAVPPCSPAAAKSLEQAHGVGIPAGPDLDQGDLRLLVILLGQQETAGMPVSPRAC